MSQKNEIEVKSWSITPPTFEKLWGNVKDKLVGLDKKSIGIVEACAENIYINFYNDIKRQLEGQ